MNNVAGIIFSNLHDRSIPELTAKRTMGAIPFGGGYRMVDFPLSSMTKAGIRNINIIAHHNYESLAEHIGSGADWGLPIECGGIKMLSPYMTAYAKKQDESYATRLESLKSICNNIERMKEKYVVMCDCDCVFNMDIHTLLEFHVSKKADLTVCPNEPLETDENGLILHIDQSPSSAFDMNVNMWMFDREYLVSLLKNAAARGLSDFTSDIIGKRLGSDKIFEYDARANFVRIKSLADYFRANMRMLFDPEMAKLAEGVRGRRAEGLPTRFGTSASVTSSLVSEGCQIDGSVENCVVFKGARVEKDAVVKNSVLFPGVNISSGSKLDFVIADRNAEVREGNTLLGCKMLPYFISSNKII